MISFVSGNSCIEFNMQTLQNNEGKKIFVDVKTVEQISIVSYILIFIFFLEEVQFLATVWLLGDVSVCIALEQKTCLSLTAHCLQLLKLKKFTCSEC